MKEDINMVKKVEEKVLYTCESEINGEEYQNAVKYFPQVYWSLVKKGTMLNILAMLLFFILGTKLIDVLIGFIVLEILILIIYKVRLPYYVSKSYSNAIKKGQIETKLHTEFYKDYFIRKGEKDSLKISYSEIGKSVETDTNIYLMYPKNKKLIIFQKKYCDEDLIEFIRKNITSLEKHLGENQVSQKESNKVNKLLNVLFIATIISLFASFILVNALLKYVFHYHGNGDFRYMWIYLCFLPIPIISVVLGIIYKNKGYNCSRNIIIGIIASIILLMYGGISALVSLELPDYHEIDAYKEFIDAKLPSNGELDIVEIGKASADKTEYVIVNAYYDLEDVTELEKSIKDSNNWFLSEEIKQELKILVPPQLHSSKTAYFSIYNKTTDEYNTLPSKSGDYDIYFMNYDLEGKHLAIHKFKYSYEQNK